MEITLDAIPTNDRQYRGGMLSTWNKVSFLIIESAALAYGQIVLLYWYGFTSLLAALSLIFLRRNRGGFHYSTRHHKRRRPLARVLDDGESWSSRLWSYARRNGSSPLVVFIYSFPVKPIHSGHTLMTHATSEPHQTRLSMASRQ